MNRMALYRAERDKAHRAKLRAAAYRADGNANAANTWAEKAAGHKALALSAMAALRGLAAETRTILLAKAA